MGKYDCWAQWSFSFAFSVRLQRVSARPKLFQPTLSFNFIFLFSILFYSSVVFHDTSDTSMRIYHFNIG